MQAWVTILRGGASNEAGILVLDEEALLVEAASLSAAHAAATEHLGVPVEYVSEPMKIVATYDFDGEQVVVETITRKSPPAHMCETPDCG